ncbi:hypothetical protein KI387_008241, partial [Taxus chinensis]
HFQMEDNFYTLAAHTNTDANLLECLLCEYVDSQYKMVALVDEATITKINNGLAKDIVDVARMLLDSKQFMKDYEKKNPSVEFRKRLRYWLMTEILNEKEHLEPPHTELLEFLEDDTIADLKKAVENMFQDVYICFKKMRVKTIVELEGIKYSVGLKFLMGRKNNVTVQVDCLPGIMFEFSTEEGVNLWTVDYSCGTIEDDGENMIE